MLQEMCSHGSSVDGSESPLPFQNSTESNVLCAKLAALERRNLPDADCFNVCGNMNGHRHRSDDGTLSQKASKPNTFQMVIILPQAGEDSSLELVHTRDH
jgi:hypothetical protein